MPRAYTIHEFSLAYKLGRTKIWQLIKSGQLNAVSVGSKKLIRSEDAEAWFASLESTSKKHAARVKQSDAMKRIAEQAQKLGLD